MLCSDLTEIKTFKRAEKVSDTFTATAILQLKEQGK
jgi:hypothetical protein